MPTDKPDFNTIFIATAAITAGPHGMTSGGILHKDRFERTFKELLGVHQDCKAIYIEHNN